MATNPLIFHFQMGAQLGEVAFEVDAGTPPGTVLAAAKAAIWTPLRPNTTTACQLVKISCGSGGLYVEQAVAEYGNKIGIWLPFNNAYMIKKQVASGKPGRFFWPGVDSADVLADGQMTTSAKTTWNAALATVHTNTGPLTSVPLTFTQKGGGAATIVGFNLGNTIGTQRRRLR